MINTSPHSQSQRPDLTHALTCTSHQITTRHPPYTARKDSADQGLDDSHPCTIHVHTFSQLSGDTGLGWWNKSLTTCNILLTRRSAEVGATSTPTKLIHSKYSINTPLADTQQIPSRSVGTESYVLAVHTLERKSSSQSHRTENKRAPLQKINQDLAQSSNKNRHEEHRRSVTHGPPTRTKRISKTRTLDGYNQNRTHKSILETTSLRIMVTVENTDRTQATSITEQYEIQKSLTRHLEGPRVHQHRAWFKQLGTRTQTQPQINLLTYRHTNQESCESHESRKHKLIPFTLTNNSFYSLSGCTNLGECKTTKSWSLNKNGNYQKPETENTTVQSAAAPHREPFQPPTNMSANKNTALRNSRSHDPRNGMFSFFVFTHLTSKYCGCKSYALHLAIMPTLTGVNIKFFSNQSP